MLLDGCGSIAKAEEQSISDVNSKTSLFFTKVIRNVEFQNCWSKYVKKSLNATK